MIELWDIRPYNTTSNPLVFNPKYIIGYLCWIDKQKEINIRV